MAIFFAGETMLIAYPFRFMMSNVKRCFNMPSKPYLLNYSITFRCNLGCEYCGVSELKNNYAEDELSAKDISLFLKDKMLKNLKVIAVTGGEPFLKDDFNEIILEFQRKVSPYVFHVTTNGFLTDKIVESIKFLKAQGVNIEIKVSIDDIADKHDVLRNRKGSFNNAIDTIQRLRRLFSEKELFIGINQTIFAQNYNSIPEVKKLAKSFCVAYRGFIGLKKRPLYTGDRQADYGLVDLSAQAKDYIKENINHILNWRSYRNNRLRFIEDIVLQNYIKGQIRLLGNNKVCRHICMCLFTHFRINPNGDVVTCSYDLDVLGNVRKEKYSAILNKKEAKIKFEKVKKCGKCWLGCEVSPNWVSSLFMF